MPQLQNAVVLLGGVFFRVSLLTFRMFWIHQLLSTRTRSLE